MSRGLQAGSAAASSTVQGLFLFNAQVVANQELKVFARHERGFLVL
jgi:hypothetical protein